MEKAAEKAADLIEQAKKEAEAIIADLRKMRLEKMPTLRNTN